VPVRGRPRPYRAKQVVQAFLLPGVNSKGMARSPNMASPGGGGPRTVDDAGDLVRRSTNPVGDLQVGRDEQPVPRAGKSGALGDLAVAPDPPRRQKKGRLASSHAQSLSRLPANVVEAWAPGNAATAHRGQGLP